MSTEALLQREFATIHDLIAEHAVQRPQAPALIQDERQLSFGQLDALMDRVAAALQRDGVQPRQMIAICASSSLEYAVAFLGALRVGVAVAPLAPSSTPEALVSMLDDCAAKLLFLDRQVAELLAPERAKITAKRIAIDPQLNEGTPWSEWRGPPGAPPPPPEGHTVKPQNQV